ncbi:MAG: response regulator [Spirochaetes bacterium]|nr:response regulator [Spirochaetota bacterium]
MKENKLLNYFNFFIFNILLIIISISFFLINSCFYNRTNDNKTYINKKDTVKILDDNINNLKGYIYYFVDKKDIYNFENIKNNEKIFILSSEEFPNFGYSSYTYWFKFKVKKNKDVPPLFFIEIAFPPLDYIELYFQDENNNYITFITGDKFNFEKRPYFHRNFIFPIKLNSDEKEYTIFIKLKTESSAVLPIKIYSEKAFIEYLYRNNLFIGIFYGILIIMLFYNLFLFLALKDLSYLFYVFHSISYIIYQSVWDGLFFQYFISNNIILNNLLNPFLMALTNLTGIFLLRFYLNIDTHSPLLFQVYRIFVIFGIIVTIIPLFLRYSLSVKITTFFILPSVIFLIFGSYISYKKGFKYSRFFLYAWSIFLVAILMNVFRAFKILPTNKFTLQLSLQYGFLFENLLLSFGLADRINTLRNEKEKSQKMLLETLEKTNKLKDEFLANTSHELRTPLNGIIGLSESILEGACGEINNEVKNNLKLIISSGKRLATLINDILDFSMIKNNELKINIEPVDVYLNVELTISILKPLVKNKPLKIINYIAQDFPFILADKNRFQQILTNIIGNSIKFSESGFIEIYGTTEDNNAIITISDTGRGIPQEKLQTIFDHYNRITDLTNIEGTGLGLPITKKLLELLNGDIKIESKVNEGTKVTIYLPLYKGKIEKISQDEYVLLSRLREDVEISKKTMESLVASNEKEIYSILIVDDEIVNLQVLTNYLILNNYKVITASSGYECLNILNKKEQKIDLIILDIMMPGLNGYEVCSEIRKTYLQTELPIILLTAKNQVSDLIEGFSVGANDFLLKPVNKPELLARIKTHIQLAKINEAYQRFVPKEFLEQINKTNILDVSLGDHSRKNMTILFCDIRDFTTLSETMNPEENFNFINSYLRRISPIIHKYGGFIDKYIGDAIMALFSDNIKIEDVINCSIEIHKEIEIYNIHRKKTGYVPIRIGISIHKGDLMLGTIGSEKRMEGTVIADCVNMASRIENLNKIFRTNVLISEDIYDIVKNNKEFNFRFIGKFKVKGKEIPVKIYELLNSYDIETFNKKIKTNELFSKFLEYFYNKEFDKAKEIGENILSLYQDDQITKLYLESIDKLQNDKITKRNLYSFLENINFFLF